MAILLIDALGAGGGTLLVKLSAHGPVELFLEDRLGIDCLELGLEVLGDVGARVASAAWIGQMVARVIELVTLMAPMHPKQSVI
jgi:hypothetical protein